MANLGGTPANGATRKAGRALPESGDGAPSAGRGAWKSDQNHGTNEAALDRPGVLAYPPKTRRTARP